MARLNRRTFLQTNAALVASAMAGKAAGAEEADSRKAQCDERELRRVPKTSAPTFWCDAGVL
jgi:hypothetical protein